MERGMKDKTSNSGRNMTITSVFKVKKCLFDSTKAEFTTPKPLPTASSLSPNSDSADDSPYSLFRTRKPRTQIATFQKEVITVSSVNYDTPQKRTNVSMNEDKENSPSQTNFDMISPGTSNSMKLAVQKAVLYPNLIGDFSKPCELPVINGKHPDLKSISPITVADLLHKINYCSFSLVDCRYPYEFEGGHIQGAINIYDKDVAVKNFFHIAISEDTKKDILIFYCEFSSERAPSMIRHMRCKDRDLNKNRYPFLHYPEVYLVEGGYNAFYSCFKELCDPQDYKTMLDKGCGDDLVYYQQQSKLWKKNSKQAKRMRSTLKF